jgi:hypothetical protein
MSDWKTRAKPVAVDGESGGASDWRSRAKPVESAPEPKEARYGELHVEPGASLTPPPAPQLSDMDPISRIVSESTDYLQEGGRYAMREMMGEALYDDRSNPHVSAFDRRFMPREQAESLGRFNKAPAPIPSEAERLLIARTAQGTTPFFQGGAVNDYLENLPEAQKGAVQLEDRHGVAGAVAAQFGAQTLGSAATEGLQQFKALLSASKLAPEVKEALLKRMLQGARDNYLINASQAPMGERAGERARAVPAALDPTDWRNLAGAGVGAGGGVLAHRAAARSQEAARAANARQEANAPTQIVENPFPPDAPPRSEVDPIPVVDRAPAPTQSYDPFEWAAENQLRRELGLPEVPAPEHPGVNVLAEAAPTPHDLTALRGVDEPAPATFVGPGLPPPYSREGIDFARHALENDRPDPYANEVLAGAQPPGEHQSLGANEIDALQAQDVTGKFDSRDITDPPPADEYYQHLKSLEALKARRAALEAEKAARPVTPTSNDSTQNLRMRPGGTGEPAANVTPEQAAVRAAAERNLQRVARQQQAASERAAALRAQVEQLRKDAPDSPELRQAEDGMYAAEAEADAMQRLHANIRSQMPAEPAAPPPPTPAQPAQDPAVRAAAERNLHRVVRQQRQVGERAAQLRAEWERLRKEAPNSPERDQVEDALNAAYTELESLHQLQSNIRTTLQAADPEAYARGVQRAHQKQLRRARAADQPAPAVAPEPAPAPVEPPIDNDAVAAEIRGEAFPGLHPDGDPDNVLNANPIPGLGPQKAPGLPGAMIAPDPKGQRVYYTEPGGSAVQQGVVRKRREDGKLIVETGNPKKPLVLVNAGDAHAVDAVARLPDVKPPSPKAIPDVQPREIPARTLTLIDRVQQLFNRLAKSHGPQKTARLLNGIMPTHRRHEADVRAAVIEGKSAQKQQMSPEELARSLQSRLPASERSLLGRASLALDQVARGVMSAGQFKAKFPELGARFHAHVDELLGKIDANDKWLQERGYVDPTLASLREKGVVEKYVANTYRVFTMKPGEWAKLVPEKVVRDAAEYIIEQNKAEGRIRNEFEVTHELMKILRADDPMKALGESKSLGTKSFGKLLARKQIPPQIAKLLGKETSGILNVAHTLANQERIINQLKYFDALAGATQMGVDGIAVNRFVSPGPTAIHTQHVENIPQKYGKLANKYVTPELAEIVTNMGKVQETSHSLVRAAVGWWKFSQTAGGAMTGWAANLMRTIPASVIIGGFDPFNPARSGRSLKNAARIILEHHDNPLFTGDRALLKEAIDAGIDIDGLATELRGDVGARLKRELKRALVESDGFENPFDVMDKIRQRVIEPLAKVKDGLSTAYGAIDGVMKFANYLSLVEKYTSQGMPRVDAVRKASDRINAYMSNFTHMSNTVERLRNSAVGFVAPFLSSIAEQARNGVELARGLNPLNGDHETQVNALKLAALSAFVKVSYDTISRMNGVDERDVEASWKQLPESGRGFRPLHPAAPTYDARGRAQHLSITNWVPFAEYFQGDPDNPAWANLAFNIVNGVTTGGFMEPVVQQMGVHAGLIEQPRDQQTRAPHPGLGGPFKLLQLMLNKGMVPGVVRQASNMLQRTGVTSAPSNVFEQYTPGQGVANMLGVPVMPGATIQGKTTDPRTGKVADRSPGNAGRAVFDVLGDMRDVDAAINRMIMDRNLSPEDRQRVIEALRQKVQQTREQNMEARDAVDRAKGARP